MTTTTSAAHASQLLLAALDNVFSIGIDARMIAAMPDFWKLYYQAAESKTDYKPTDPGVFRQSAVDQKAKLISAIDPPSNEFAQANGVAGMALYHAVIGSDGKVEEVVAARPIGFGLDESAEQTIRKAIISTSSKERQTRSGGSRCCRFIPNLFEKNFADRHATNECEGGRACPPGSLYRANANCGASYDGPVRSALQSVVSQLLPLPARYAGPGGSHNSTRLPSGSQIHANRPYA